MVAEGLRVIGLARPANSHEREVRDEAIDAMDDQPPTDACPVCRRRVVPSGSPTLIHHPLLAELVGDRVTLPEIDKGVRLPTITHGIEVLDVVEVVSCEQERLKHVGA